MLLPDHPLKKNALGGTHCPSANIDIKSKQKPQESNLCFEEAFVWNVIDPPY